mgnify:CR=1 FL=1
MAYTIKKSDGTTLTTIADGDHNTIATNLDLAGPNFVGYGQALNENLVYLLENFASNVAPLTPILGQLWYNSDTGVLSAYNNANAWTSMASTDDVTVAITASKISPAFSGVPTAPTATVGTSTNQLATTAFVQNSFANFSGNATLTGNSTAVTAAFGTNTTQIATTAFVKSVPLSSFAVPTTSEAIFVLYVALVPAVTVSVPLIVWFAPNVTVLIPAAEVLAGKVKLLKVFEIALLWFWFSKIY